MAGYQVTKPEAVSHLEKEQAIVERKSPSCGQDILTARMSTLFPLLSTTLIQLSEGQARKHTGIPFPSAE
ncbi:hypothetical protein MC885_015590 [Smutsia gigantea]|nr:hypothetical protein MC885_015590 [Smutsia gigantea]